MLIRFEKAQKQQERAGSHTKPIALPAIPVRELSPNTLYKGISGKGDNQREVISEERKFKSNFNNFDLYQTFPTQGKGRKEINPL